MDDPVEVLASGAGWVRQLKADAGPALRDVPVWIGLGTGLAFALLLALPLSPGGIAAFTCAMVLLLGMLARAARPDPTRRHFAAFR